MRQLVLIHVSDIHLGRTPHGIAERHEDIFRSFQQVLDYAVEVRPDAVVIGGDLFDVPRPSLSDVKRAASMIRRVASRGVKFVVAHGEHDKPKRREASVLEVLGELIDGFVAPVMRSKPPAGIRDVTVRLGDAEFYVVHFEHDAPSRWRGFLERQLSLFDAAARSSDARWKVLVGHFALEQEFGALEEAAVSADSLPSVNYAALGHIHRHSVRLDARVPYAYPGVLDPFTETEAEHGGHPLLVEISGDGEVRVERLKVERRPQVRVRIRLEHPPSSLYQVIRQEMAARLRERRLPAGGLKPLVHLRVEAPPPVTFKSVVDAALRAARELGVMVAVSDVTVVKGGHQARAEAPAAGGPVNPKTVAMRRFGLTREEAELIFDVLVPSLIDGDEERARRVIEELASRRGEQFWRSIIQGAGRLA